MGKKKKKPERVTKHDLYDTLWSGRDFEISHLWQRSIFLATFLVLLFTVYFSTLDHIFFEKEDAADKYSTVSVTSSISNVGKSNSVVSIKEEEEKDVSALLSAAILDVLCLAGFSFSVLWLCMAKGSKYWYERHEAGIRALYDNQHGFFDNDLNCQLHIDWYEKMWHGGNYRCTPHHDTLPLPDYSHNFYSLKGSSFSTSKINIMIGYIFILAWIVMNFFQLFLLKDSSYPFMIILSLVLVFLFYAFLYFLLCYLVQSRNCMKFSDYLILAFMPDRKIRKEDERQDLWVADFIAGGTRESYRVINNLKEYVDKHEEPFRKVIIGQVIGKSKPELEYIRLLRSDEMLWSIFETTLMQRDRIPKQFHGIWSMLDGSGKVLFGYDVEIKEDDIIGRSRYGVSYFIDLKKEWEYRAYIDNDWKRIRQADNRSEEISLKDFDRKAKSIHLIAKPNGSKDILYITLTLKECVQDSPKYLEVMLMYGNTMEKDIYILN